MAGLHYLSRSKLGKTLYPKPVQCHAKPTRNYEVEDEFGEVELNGNPEPVPAGQGPVYESQADARQKSMCLRIIAGTFAIGLLVTLILVPSMICELIARKLTCNSTLEYGIVFGITSGVSIIVFCVVSCCCWKCTTSSTTTLESNASSIAHPDPDPENPVPVPAANEIE